MAWLHHDIHSFIHAAYAAAYAAAVPFLRWGWVKQGVRHGAFSGPGASAWATGVDTRFGPRGVN